jgi:hypothetical protein
MNETSVTGLFIGHERTQRFLIFVGVKCQVKTGDASRVALLLSRVPGFFFPLIPSQRKTHTICQASSVEKE